MLRVRSHLWCPLLAALTGCVFDGSGPSPQPYDDASTSDPTIDGGDDSADAGPDARVVVPDRDGDGVPDDRDVCPDLGNADQRDHDHDGRGDPCDECPHLPAATVDDEDGDGVGNACDPHPDTPGDRIVRFEGFYDDVDGIPAGWIARGTGGKDWRVKDGFLEQTRLDRSIHLLLFDSSLGGQTVDASMRVDAVAPRAGADAVRAAGAVGGAERSGNSTQMWACLLRDDLTTDGGTVVRLLEFLSGGGIEDVSTPSPAPLAAGTTVRLRLSLYSDDADPPALAERCDATPAGAASPTSATSSDAVAITGAVGVRTQGVKAGFDYVVIYDLKP